MSIFTERDCLGVGISHHVWVCCILMKRNWTAMQFAIVLEKAENVWVLDSPEGKAEALN